MKITPLFEQELITEAKMARTEEAVHKWFEEHRIHAEHIEVENGMVTVNGDVEIHGYTEMKQLGVQFYKVTGNFQLNHNGLMTLKGCPEIIGGNARFSGKDIKSLADCGIKEVGGNLLITATNITNLNGCPQHVEGDLEIRSNDKLTTLVGIAKRVNGSVLIESNPIKKWDALPEHVGKILDIHDYYSKVPITSLKGIGRMVKHAEVIRVGAPTHDIMGLALIGGLKNVEMSYTRNTPSGFNEKQFKKALEIIRPYFGRGDDRDAMMELQDKLTAEDLDDYAAI